MYNKLFTKILDSTIWLESNPTRIVWITFLAVMDEDGFVALSAVGNVAARARVTMDEAQSSIDTLEAPDSADPSQEFEGRRIERVPYGWMVLNAGKYRDLIKRETAKIQTRARVAKHRKKKHDEALGNAPVTQANEKVTPSVSDTSTSTSTRAKGKTSVAAVPLPDWIEPEKWRSWLAIRPAKARSAAAQRAALDKLAAWKALGMDPNVIVGESLANGWQGLFLPKAGGITGGMTLGQKNRAAGEEAQRRFEEQHGKS